MPIPTASLPAECAFLAGGKLFHINALNATSIFLNGF